MSSNELILVVEDERSLREGIAMNLRLNGYRVTTASDGDEGMQQAFDARPDLIILDIMMPGWSGLDILDELRKQKEKVPVLILSARGGINDKVNGLDLGADDYLTKPFDLPELLARIRVILRRQAAEKQEHSVLQVGAVTINRSARTVEIDGAAVHLSAKEFDLLCLLADPPGRVYTREAVLKKVWGWDYEGTERTVDNFVAALRKKLGAGVRICTVPRVGYKLLKK